jgi:predicted aspartyl protease
LRWFGIYLADRSMVQTAHVNIDHVAVGSKVKRDLNVTIMPRLGSEEIGLLGMNFLKEFTYILDASAGIIRWQ